MKTKNDCSSLRGAFTLMELMVATAMLAALSVATMTLVRTSYVAWQRHETDQEPRQAAIAVLRHIVRHARQASAVVGISDPSDSSGTLYLQMDAGDIYVWDFDSANKRVLFGISSATEVLATGIDELTFEGYRSDGSTQTTSVDLIHMVRAKTKVTIDRPGTDETVTYSCQALLRSW